MIPVTHIPNVNYGINAAVQALFSGGAKGVWYDPSNYSTLFQDSAGTTPVTAVEQPVGLMLDKSQGLVLGPELVTNGDFSDGLVGWTNAGNGTMRDNGGLLQYTRSSETGIVNQTYGDSSTVNKWYQITARCRSVSGGGSASVRLSTAGGTVFGTSAAVTSSAWNDVVAYGVVPSGATGVVASLIVGSPSGTIAEFDNISVKELPGNHAFQSTSASRPVLSARYNLLTKTEQFDDAAWSKIETTVASGFTDSVGASKAWKLQENSANANHLISISPTGVSSTTNRWSVEVKAGERNYVLLFGAGIGGAYFNLTDGTSVNYSTAPDNKGSVNLGNGWWRIWIEKNAITSNCQLYTSDTGSRFVYQGTAGSGIYFAFPDLRPTNQSTLPYQRVNTSTDYATTGFLPYLKFDGVDDSMSTNSINFTSTDKMSVFAGVRKLTNTFQMYCELSASISANNGTFLLYGSGTGSQQWLSKGTVAVDVGSSVTAAPITQVLTGVASISTDVTTLRINGTQAATSAADQGTGNYGNYPLFIGSRNNASQRFNGQMYSMTIVGKQVTATELSSTETYTAIKTGVTLA